MKMKEQVAAQLFVGVQEQLEKKYEGEDVHILVSGATGSGKSTLVNLVFDEDLAQTGVGTPVTQQTEKYMKEDYPIVIYDTKGYELTDATHALYEREIANMMATEKLHLMWHCVSAASRRVLDYDIQFIEQCKREQWPVCAVLTKADQTDVDGLEAMKAELAKLDVPVFAVSQVPALIDKLDLQALIEWSGTQLEAGQRQSFAMKQRHHMKLKRKEGINLVGKASAISGTVALTPIPFADAPLLIANQTKMVADLIRMYDLKGSQHEFMQALQGLIGGTIMANLGRSAAAQASKLVPGAGSIVGGAMNATIATSITYALGYTVNEVCYQFKVKEKEEANLSVVDFFNNFMSPDQIQSIFDTVFKKKNDESKD